MASRETRTDRNAVLLAIVGWFIWQLFIFAFVIIVYGNLFGEYGRFRGRVVESGAAVLLFGAAIVIGTYIPVRRWRTRGGPPRG